MTRPAFQLVGGPSGPLSLRERLEAEVERLIALLDALDGDPDLEPWLADTDPVLEDREGDDDGEPNDWDAEPSLGWARTRNLPPRVVLRLGWGIGGDGNA